MPCTCQKLKRCPRTLKCPRTLNQHKSAGYHEELRQKIQVKQIHHLWFNCYHFIQALSYIEQSFKNWRALLLQLKGRKRNISATCTEYLKHVRWNAALCRTSAEMKSTLVSRASLYFCGVIWNSHSMQTPYLPWEGKPSSFCQDLSTLFLGSVCFPRSHCQTSCTSTHYMVQWELRAIYFPQKPDLLLISTFFFWNIGLLQGTNISF